MVERPCYVVGLPSAHYFRNLPAAVGKLLVGLLVGVTGSTGIFRQVAVYFWGTEVGVKRKSKIGETLRLSGVLRAIQLRLRGGVAQAFYPV